MPQQQMLRRGAARWSQDCRHATQLACVLAAAAAHTQRKVSCRGKVCLRVVQQLPCSALTVLAMGMWIWM